MKKILALSLVFMLFASGVVLAGSVKEYSADMVDVESGAVVARIFVADQKMRIFSPGDENGGNLYRIDQGKEFLLFGNKKTYTEFSSGANTQSSLTMNNHYILPISGPKVMRESLGMEEVNRYQATKYRVTNTETVTQSLGLTMPVASTVTVTHYEWLAKEFDIPVRTQNQNGKIAELRNIKAGPLAASLFEIPADYKKDTTMEDWRKESEQWHQEMEQRSKPKGLRLK